MILFLDRFQHRDRENNNANKPGPHTSQDRLTVLWVFFQLQEPWWPTLNSLLTKSLITIISTIMHFWILIIYLTFVPHFFKLCIYDTVFWTKCQAFFQLIFVFFQICGIIHHLIWNVDLHIFTLMEKRTQMKFSHQSFRVENSYLEDFLWNYCCMNDKCRLKIRVVLILSIVCVLDSRAVLH